MLFHGAKTGGIRVLRPHVSNHGRPLIYFSQKRENVLVYLCNPVERFCRESGFPLPERCYTWASYGFDPDGVLRLEEYYPHAAREAYSGARGYLYSVEDFPEAAALEGIPFAFTAEKPVSVSGCEPVPDVYQAILEAERAGRLRLRRYEDNSPKMLAWIERAILQDYALYEDHPEYRHFLKAKFPEILKGK